MTLTDLIKPLLPDRYNITPINSNSTVAQIHRDNIWIGVIGTDKIYSFNGTLSAFDVDFAVKLVSFLDESFEKHRSYLSDIRNMKLLDDVT
jgi:hypothetical protein